MIFKIPGLRACIALQGQIVNGKAKRKRAIASCPEAQALRLPHERQDSVVKNI